MLWLFSCIATLLFPGSASLAQEVFICVWRNPERTMTRLFPDARDYRTVSLAISADALARIEKRLGDTVLPGQREQFQYFEMLDGDGAVIGYTQAMTQRGEFGAIEFVFGLNPDRRIVRLYIQRQRERDRRFRDPAFLDKFANVSIADADALEDPEGANATVGTRAVTQGIRKALIAFDELVLKAE